MRLYIGPFISLLKALDERNTESGAGCVRGEEREREMRGNRESYLRFGDKRLPRDGEAVLDGAVGLCHDRQATPLSAPRARRQPLRERKY